MNVGVTLLMTALLVWQLPGWVSWSMVHAVVQPDADACQTARGLVLVGAWSAKNTG